MSDINVSSAINTFASYQSTAINTNRTTAKTTAAASKGAADTVDNVCLGQNTSALKH